MPITVTFDFLNIDTNTVLDESCGYLPSDFFDDEGEWFRTLPPTHEEIFEIALARYVGAAPSRIGLRAHAWDGSRWETLDLDGPSTPPRLLMDPTGRMEEL